MRAVLCKSECPWTSGRPVVAGRRMCLRKSNTALQAAFKGFGKFDPAIKLNSKGCPCGSGSDYTVSDEGGGDLCGMGLFKVIDRAMHAARERMGVRLLVSLNRSTVMHACRAMQAYRYAASSDTASDISCLLAC